jgi:hypothetical protein
MSPDPATTELPATISMYLDARDRHDLPVSLARFTPDAIITDEGHTYEGSAGVETFLRTAGTEFTFTRTLVEAIETAPGEWLVTNHLEGNFPGGTADLRYRFQLSGDLIARLDIAP